MVIFIQCVNLALLKTIRAFMDLYAYLLGFCVVRPELSKGIMSLNTNMIAFFAQNHFHGYWIVTNYRNCRLS